MEKRRETRSRGETKSEVEGKKDLMTKKDGILETEAGDLDTTRKADADLDYGGSLEGSTEVQKAMERAKNETEAVFEKDSGALDQTHAESEQDKTGLESQLDSTKRDAKKIQEAGSSVETRETKEGLADAARKTDEDSDFFDEQSKLLDAAIAESKRIQSELQSQVRSKGK